jgi:hypothetical protein
LRDHNAALDDRSAALDDRSAALDDHSAALDDRSAALRDHSAALDDRSAALRDHNAALRAHNAADGTGFFPPPTNQQPMPAPLTWDTSGLTWDSGATWDGAAVSPPQTKSMNPIKARIDFSRSTQRRMTEETAAMNWCFWCGAKSATVAAWTFPSVCCCCWFWR